MFPMKSRITCDARDMVASTDLQSHQARESMIERRKRNSRRKFSVADIGTPILDELQRATSRLSWIMHTSVIATSVKKQASSVLYQFARRKRSQVENPVIDVTTCSSQSTDSPNCMSPSMDAVNRHNKCRSLSVTVYDKASPTVPPGQSYSLTSSPFVDRVFKLTSPHSDYPSESHSEQTSCYCSNASVHKPCLSLELPGNEDEDDEEDEEEEEEGAKKVRTKRLSCSHVKFSDELNTVSRFGAESPGLGSAILDMPRFSLPVINHLQAQEEIILGLPGANDIQKYHDLEERTGFTPDLMMQYESIRDICKMKGIPDEYN
ncbi:hypothetical protein FGIG_07297 [Fasciola gigantica]|uniref:Uncharacterized protein n=1 Tax=Fasciola gigantica TaxID=46835 RepID=A0A504YG46_FASGI|nr:hypothetical protein FGIG_07297 [Fasciola gigantica]